MTINGTSSSTTTPVWPHCSRGADPVNDPVGCRGRQVTPYTECLAHLTDAERATYLSTLAPGKDIDHSGTHLSAALLDEILNAIREPVSRRPRFGLARFRETIFFGGARFNGTVFSNDAQFSDATFSDAAIFSGATFTTAKFIHVQFTHVASFDSVDFSGAVRFSRSQFEEVSRFAGVTFSDEVWFTGVDFLGTAIFKKAKFCSKSHFDSATFSGDATFNDSTFEGQASFDAAAFAGICWFSKANFREAASFCRASFSKKACFGKSSFSAVVKFDQAIFSGAAQFDNVSFAQAKFFEVVFSGDTEFRRAVFSGDAGFSKATFGAASHLGPLVCHQAFRLSAARFNNHVTIEAAARYVVCDRTRWDSVAALRLRYSTVDLQDAVFEYPLSVTARTAPFALSAPEGQLAARDAGVRMSSLQGTDAAHLALYNVDLGRCNLAGTVHLDQLRLEGDCPLALVPSGLRLGRLLPLRWTPRRTLAEEQHWRAAQGLSGWRAAPPGKELVGPEQLAPVYRQLRKAFEDSKNEPDAADFYYGEMEMRRHDRTRPHAERWLLALYWAVSGYGLRASRALGLLFCAMAATVLVMMLWGLPVDAPKPATTGSLAGQRISLTTDKPAPANPGGSLASRLTSERWEKSVQVVVNSVFFRSSGEDLTTRGTYTEMASRLAEPLFLGLAVLAIRGRVKR
ncbi:pentapeptide repeat-containing protein [Streptomyces phaeochromogenes]|uniref:pentapeptide repeat-containing protein n=1 Tax=Streptomyces phaeochromogenes TaxID=1923 RepID=UPI0036BC5273